MKEKKEFLTLDAFEEAYETVSEVTLETKLIFEHNQFVSINRNAAVELRITLEAFGTDHKNRIMKALRKDGYKPELIRPASEILI